MDLINPKHSFKTHLTNSHDVSDSAIAKGDNKPDAFTKLKNGDQIFYKNINPTDIRRWLPATFLRQVSDATFQISLGGRIVLAHKRQLKLSFNSRRKGTVIFPHESDAILMPDPAPILSPERNPEAEPVSSSIEAPFLSSSSNVLSPTLI